MLRLFQNRFKVYLKYTSLLNSWWTQSIIERYKSFSKLFSNCFHTVVNFEKQNMSKSILEVYFIFRVQQYTFEVSSSNSTGQNNSRSLHNLWSNGLVVMVEVYQIPGSKP